LLDLLALGLDEEALVLNDPDADPLEQIVGEALALCQNAFLVRLLLLADEVRQLVDGQEFEHAVPGCSGEEFQPGLAGPEAERAMEQIERLAGGEGAGVGFGPALARIEVLIDLRRP
jgi:hypothetical protein